MKKVIGWILFAAGIIGSRLLVYGSTIEPRTITIEGKYGQSFSYTPDGGGGTPIVGIIIIALCFIGWYLLAIHVSKKEKAERERGHQYFLQREKEIKEYQANKLKGE